MPRRRIGWLWGLIGIGCAVGSVGVSHPRSVGGPIEGRSSSGGGVAAFDWGLSGGDDPVTDGGVPEPGTDALVERAFERRITDRRARHGEDALPGRERSFLRPVTRRILMSLPIWHFGQRVASTPVSRRRSSCQDSGVSLASSRFSSVLGRPRSSRQSGMSFFFTLLARNP